MILRRAIIFLRGCRSKWTAIIIIFVPDLPIPPPPSCPAEAPSTINPILWGTLVFLKPAGGVPVAPGRWSASIQGGLAPARHSEQDLCRMMPYNQRHRLQVIMYLWPGRTLWPGDYLYGA